MRISWNADNTVSIDPPSRPKKLTGTRLAAVLGLNRWATPFQVWCEVTKAYVPPFEDSKYTLAGKAIEPLQIAYMRKAWGMDNLKDPTDIYGPDFFKKTWGNFFTDKVFGGMWDSILVDEEGKPEAVLEFKTTKRAGDWAEDVPEYYALQAALYAYLLGVEDVIMVASFLEESDYEHPELYKPNAENTAVIEFQLHERYPNFEQSHLRPALEWWETHVEGGVSPAYDEKADAEYLKALRNTSLNPMSDVEKMVKECADLMRELEAASKATEVKEKRLKALKEQLKQYMLENIGDHDTATLEGSGITLKLAKSTSMKVDEAKLKKDGLFDRYSKETESTRLTVAFNKE